MNFLYTIPWVVWFLWFVAWEAGGFRKGNDKWPTISQIVKWWEFHDTPVSLSTGEQVPFTTGMQTHGIVTWTWRRWSVAFGLPLLAIVLELHWVWEVF